MAKEGKSKSMLVSTLIMALLASVLFFISYYKGRHVEGLKASFVMIREISPLLIFAFIVAGMVNVLMPKDLLSKWMGEGSGIKGIFIGALAGACSLGGPYVSFPLAAALLNSGASIGRMVAFLTGWSLCSVSRLPVELASWGGNLPLSA
ncbi:MAG: permease [Candidatus Omnitrophota bacterium]